MVIVSPEKILSYLYRQYLFELFKQTILLNLLCPAISPHLKFSNGLKYYFSFSCRGFWIVEKSTKH
jgi:hypothetical protein